ncbi:unnamed protein product [Diplocarpon coronariae]
MELYALRDLICECKDNQINKGSILVREVQHHLRAYFAMFNAHVEMVFNDSTDWKVRFSRVGMISDDHTDEKVSKDVTALTLVHDRIGGPSFIMGFIDSVGAIDVFEDQTAKVPTMFARDGISKSGIIFIFGELASFRLQVFTLDSDQKGSLPSPTADAQSCTLIRLLNLKAHGILRDGVVEIFIVACDRSQGFATTIKCFQYLADQDWKQLVDHPNSIYGPFHDSSNHLASEPEYYYCKFKLICNYFRLANLVCRSREDITVIEIVDLDWPYIRSAQLFGSVPWWLLQDRFPPKIVAKCFKYLEIFVRDLEKKEAGLRGHERELSTGFHDHHSYLSTILRRRLGAAERVWREKSYDNAEELDAFVATRRDSGEMTSEEFVDDALKEPSWPPGSSSKSKVIIEMRNDKVTCLPQMLASSSLHRLKVLGT